MSLSSGPYYIHSNGNAVGVGGSTPAPQPVIILPFNDDRIRDFGKWEVIKVDTSSGLYRLSVFDRDTGAGGFGNPRFVMASAFNQPSPIEWVLRQVGDNKYRIQDSVTQAVWGAAGELEPVLLRPSGGDSANEVFDFIPINDLD